MVKVSRKIPLSDLCHDSNAVMKMVSSSREPFFITANGRDAAVIVSMEGYETARRRTEILALLARGEKDIESGVGYELDEVLAEGDDFLEAKNQLVGWTKIVIGLLLLAFILLQRVIQGGTRTRSA